MKDSDGDGMPNWEELGLVYTYLFDGDQNHGLASPDNGPCEYIRLRKVPQDFDVYRSYKEDTAFNHPGYILLCTLYFNMFFIPVSGITTLGTRVKRHG